ncbi:hypothetical protein FISHEDRAFT_74661 [Fistulina hepatica ATCC 64428]|uniref:Uncharacterized protein n=1 Tax=Fistulina hepatica ATCC 64428 TaxID=1128425 RepID=A0A0D7ABP6_9AGAR|nr:hypothetical protein FISHEDRAFT_74661 [Fistulina hepatica ATCC 64428]
MDSSSESEYEFVDAQDEVNANIPEPENTNEPKTNDLKQVLTIARERTFLKAKRKPRPPPEGGYPEPLNPFKSKNPPPSPCRICSGPHWDNEHPGKEKPSQKNDKFKKREVKFIASESGDKEADELYVDAYKVSHEFDEAIQYLSGFDEAAPSLFESSDERKSDECYDEPQINSENM